MTFRGEPDPGALLVPALGRDGRGGAVLLSTGAGCDVHRWDPATGRLLWRFTGAGPVSEVAVACPPRRGPLVAVATDLGVERVDAATGTAVPDEEMGDVDTIWDVTCGVLPDGRAFIAGAAQCEGLVHCWDAATAERLGPLPANDDRPVKAVTSMTLPDGTVLIAAENEAGVIRRWDAATSEPVGAPIHGAGEYTMRLVSLAMPGNRSLLASLDMNGTLSRWDAITGEQVGGPPELGPDAVGIAAGCLGDTGMLFISTVGGPTEVRDIISGAPAGTPFPGVNPSALTCPDGSLLLATGGARTGEMHLYRLTVPAD
ncbi:PQQ-binding-like beta-propeller repeat protein [Streptomyces sp. NBC_01476]|uniref:WD40 repeat domain-containing protein n=1 Tax=Streptomyces sp. NBC_01476 TaxID=2903881 RepID=UPI002E33714B|nr:PQQ-binding-like beta-propeller repeat protein [Streptomyces sp. NBC_01476]